MAFASRTMESPVGVLTLVASPVGLTAILWPGEDPRRVPLPALNQDRDDVVLQETERQLAAYFAGRRRAFDVPLDFIGTEFQKTVWRALLQIPYGETRSYGEIAQAIGSPRAVRAVGAANGRNPISIIAPCHRVVGAAGELTGFAGGLAAKVKLLAIEGRRYGEGATARSREGGAPARSREARLRDEPTLFAGL